MKVNLCVFDFRVYIRTSIFELTKLAKLREKIDNEA